MISLNEAKRRADELQEEGRKLLGKHKVLDMLNPLGELHIDGSFVYRLVKPDIDMHIYVEEIDIRPIADIARKLILDGATRVHISNKQGFIPDGPGKPRGVYLGFRLFEYDKEWNFDIWIIRPEDELDVETFKPGWHEVLTDEQRDSILWLKYNLKEQGRYPGIGVGKFASADIYRSVMMTG